MVALRSYVGRVVVGVSAGLELRRRRLASAPGCPPPTTAGPRLALLSSAPRSTHERVEFAERLGQLRHERLERVGLGRVEAGFGRGRLVGERR
jgi:hypothetical protein